MNRIVGLHDEDGKWISNENCIEKIAVGYFDGLFRITSPSEFDDFLEEVPVKITHQINQRLLRTVTEDEVRKTLFL